MHIPLTAGDDHGIIHVVAAELPSPGAAFSATLVGVALFCNLL